MVAPGETAWDEIEGGRRVASSGRLHGAYDRRVIVTPGLHASLGQLVAGGLLIVGLVVVLVAKWAGRLVVIAAAVVELVSRFWPHGWPGHH
jgi:hypothetical protein